MQKHLSSSWINWISLIFPTWIDGRIYWLKGEVASTGWTSEKRSRYVGQIEVELQFIQSKTSSSMSIYQSVQKQADESFDS